LQEVSFVPAFEDISVEYAEGESIQVTMHDGSRLQLRKLEEDYDPTDKIEAVKRLMQAHEKGEVLTGVFYVSPQAENFLEMLNATERPLATLPQEITRPPKSVLEECMERLR
jgi:2-oxoglutarate ferredoxin oxidoreductase subunit beta